MIKRLSHSLWTGSPPKIEKSGSLSTPAPQEPREANSPKDRADLAFERLQSSDPAQAQTPKQSTFALFGAAAMLGLTGLGMLQGGSASPPPLAETEMVTESTVHTQAPSLLTQLESTPEMVVAGRQGQLLGAGKILKFDQYPTLQNERLSERIAGAPNFRQVEGTEVYGVAQPTVDGIRAVLDRTGAKERTVMWTNMREEPVVYINGRSFSLRDISQPFENAHQFDGSSTEQTARTEQQLKAEVLAEAQANGGRLLLHGESATGDVTSEWVEITPESVKTTQEVYDGLKAEGYQVDFARIPVTDEKTPEVGDLQALTRRLGGVSADTPQIFNCHAGRGRTTTAMVASQLIQRATPPQSADKPFHRIDSVRADIKEQGRYERGDYRRILSLIKNLDDGVAAKSETDQVLDQTEHMQNLRTDINKYRERSLSSQDAGSAEKAEARGLDYLHRYHTLITFNQYVREQAPEGFKVPFEQWLEARPEITRMLESFELAMTTPTPGQITTAHA